MRKPPVRPRIEPPSALVVVAGAVILVTGVLAVLGALRTGITTDEPVHVMRLRNYFDNGWYALDWDYRGDGPGSATTNTFVYAPVAMLLLHAWSVLFGVEGWGEVSGSAHAYDVRHLGVVLIGMLGLLAVAALGRALLGSWRWGVVAAGVLAAMPIWTGFSMFNVKDIPVATGHTLVTLGVVLLVRSEAPRRSIRVLRALSLVGGLILALGTRPGMWPGLTALVLVGVLGIVLAARSRRQAATGLADLVLGCTAAAGALIAIYPPLFASPREALPRTSETSSNFRPDEEVNRFYIPQHLATDLPTLLLFFALTGAAVGVLVILRGRREDPVAAARIALVGVQATAMPLAAIVLGSDLYHGLRQLLFIVPALAVLTTYGMSWWWQRERGTRWRPVLIVAASAALILPTADQVGLQPYQTAYANLATDVVTRLTGGESSGADSWRASLPELLDGAELDTRLLCKTAVDERSDTTYSFYETSGGKLDYSTRRSLDCREEATGPLAPDGMPVPVAGDERRFDAVFLKRVPRNCEPVREVSRRRHGFTVVLTVLGRCTVDPPVLTASGVSAQSASFATGRFDDLWRFAVDGWLQWPGDPQVFSPVRRAGIALRLTRDCARRGCTLNVFGVSPADLQARVDGTRTRVRRASDGSLRLRITARAASRPDGVWITLTRRSGGTLDMTLTELSVTEASSAGPKEGQE